MLSKLGTKGLAILALAALVVAGSAAAAGADLTWLAIAGLGTLQIAILGLLLLLRWSISKPAAALRQVDTLTARMMAAIETERLEAGDRHQELLAAVKGHNGAKA